MAANPTTLERALGKKSAHKEHGGDPKKVVRKLIKAGKVKKKCCRSRPRCKKCPVLALKKAKRELAEVA